MKNKAIIFDLDGTLLDSMKVWNTVDDIFFERRGLKKPDNYAKECSMRSFYEIAVYTIEILNLTDTPEMLISEWTELAINEYTNNVPLKTGAKDFINKTIKRGYKTAICTSLTEELYSGALTSNNIKEYFPLIVSAAEYGKGKQYPDIYIETAKLLDVPVENCIMIDDVAQSLIAAREAGMKTVGVNEPDGLVQSEEEMKSSCDLFVDILDDKIFELFE